MKIESLKDLEALIKVCRKHGVEAVSFNGLSMNLGQPVQPRRRKNAGSDADIETEGEYTEDQMLFWSSTPDSV